MEVDEFPKLIYFDQNAWIELVKMEEKPEKSDSEKKILKIIYSSVDSGKALFPLSIVHMDETSKILSKRQREQLARMMSKLSKGYSFSPYVDSHIEVQVQQLVSEKLGCESIDPRTIFLKQGVEHLVGAKGTLVSKNGDKSKKPPKEVVDKVAQALLDPDTIALLLINSKPNSSIQEAQKNAVEIMEKNRRKLLIHTDRNLRRRVFLAQNFLDIVTPHIIRILIEEGLPPDFLLHEGMTREEFDPILEKIPTGLTLMHLTMRRDMQFGRPIHINDIADIWGMSLAIPYSDIVVTEKMMATLARQSKLDSICDTKILTSVHDLIPLLKSCEK